MSTFTLPSILTIEAASKFADELRGLEINGDLTLIASDVEKIDTTGIQLLLALVIKQRENGHEVDWQQCSEILISTAEQLGVVQQLAL